MAFITYPPVAAAPLPSSVEPLTFKSIPLLDNQTTPQLLFSYSCIYKFSFFLFSIEREGNASLNYHHIITDGATVNPGGVTGTSWPDAPRGINLSRKAEGGQVGIYYTSTKLGVDGVFKYTTIAQWS